MISQTARLVCRLVSVIVLASLCACASQPSQQPPPGVGETYSKADRAAAVALQQIGTPYRYGGSTPMGFDCSGLIHYAYSSVGQNVPRTTGSLWSGIKPVSRNKVQVGDVLFFRIEGKMSHVGMYVGEDQFVHAPSSGKTVKLESLRSEFYSKALIRAGRPE